LNVDHGPVTEDQTLLIHLGGLGDVCLSESSFLSFSKLFGSQITALGYVRFLNLFHEHFAGVRSVEERRWLPLFSGDDPGRTWQRIILVGKDRTGDLRQRLFRLSRDPLLFIDMYPDEESIHVEEHQLRQIKASGIEALKKEVVPRLAERVILYPEEPRGKRKWPYENFLALAGMLNGRGVNTILLEAPDVNVPARGSLRFDGLDEMAAFFGSGGIFFSNDSGVAHLAGACGLATVTLFHDQNPVVWHPRGKNISIACDELEPSIPHIASLILKITASGIQ
jgi:ADP-heptose:LPS heptosyltransferase